MVKTVTGSLRLALVDRNRNRNRLRKRLRKRRPRHFGYRDVWKEAPAPFALQRAAYVATKILKQAGAAYLGRYAVGVSLTRLLVDCVTCYRCPRLHIDKDARGTPTYGAQYQNRRHVYEYARISAHAVERTREFGISALFMNIKPTD